MPRKGWNPVAKKKIKKIRREIDRLYQNGRYWEWLQRIQAEQIADQYPRELDQAWKSLTRKALRLPAGLEEFRARVSDQLNPPKLPDFDFLMALKRLCDGDDSALRDLATIKGLSPAAAILRDRARGWGVGIWDRNRLSKLLKPFAEQPESVTQRHFEQLGMAVGQSELAVRVKQLGTELPAFRRLNQRPTVRRGWNAISPTQLKRMDRAVVKASTGLPEALRRLLLLPFCVQVSALLRRFAPERKTDDLAALVAGFPFLFPLVAGDRAEELTDRLMAFNAGATTGLDPQDLKRRIESSSLEDNLLLLNRMRAALQEKPTRQGGPLSGLFDFLEGPDEDLKTRARLFRSLYDKLIAQIAARSKDLPSRENKELRRVMEPIVIGDLPLLFDDASDGGRLARLLDRLFTAGCAGKRLALLTLLVARRERLSSLVAAAEQVLDQSSPVDPSDIRWLTEEFDLLYFPRLRVLIPLLDRFRADPSLLTYLIGNIHSMIDEILVTNAMAGRKGLLSFLGGFGTGERREDFRIVRLELEALKEYPELDRLRTLVACFATGRYTKEGFLGWLAYLRSQSDWPEMLPAELRRLFHRRDNVDEGPLSFGIALGCLDEQISALLGFIKQHSADFQTMDLAAIQELIRLLTANEQFIRDQTILLIRIGNILEQRLQAGEAEAATVQKVLLPLIKKPAEARPKGRKSRRSRR
ncbi:MAG: hypothetical protein AUK55_10400 [Syntrophobacteraceae bacterium CG2_30_61_12]|nr:MAG: hypothetical protein AUK55_10400 [Syntrophobacteraceae bacterium CG2_30_61_12]